MVAFMHAKIQTPKVTRSLKLKIDKFYKLSSSFKQLQIQLPSKTKNLFKTLSFPVMQFNVEFFFPFVGSIPGLPDYPQPQKWPSV